VGALAPLAIDFDNTSDPHWTRMEVRGADTPGFLYALATALAVRNLYVHEVDIASVGREARDVFLIGGREGRKLEDPRELARLRVAVALVKQFSHLLPLAPDPARALRSFGQLVDRVLDEDAPGLHLLDSPEGLRELARLLGASAFLWEDFIRLQSEHLLPVLDSWRERPLRGRAELVRELSDRAAAAPTFEERQRVVNELKDEEMLLADVRHLVDPEVDLLVFSAAISDLAEAVVEVALSACLDEVARREGVRPPEDGAPWPVAALGLGKLGGREMGYASDLELVFVYEPAGPLASAPEPGRFVEQAVQELTRFVVARQEGIFHIDLRLRPHGAKGPLASPLQALAEYYRPGGGAAPFERQALLKLRPVAGDAALGARAIAARDAFVWSGEPWDRADALHLRERQSRELVPAGRFHVKYSPGALVEVEYAAQYLQLEHGREHAELRTPSTLEALDRLGEAGLVGAADREALRAAYLFWRRVVDALRMVRGNARDLLLPDADSDELRFLARRLGYSGTDWKQAGRAFLADLRSHREAVERFFSARFRGA
jgi:glutamate-ammonia-ligase adenylyltransferase